MAQLFNDPSPITNIPELSVGELSMAVKSAIEQAFGYVRVRGELSKVTLAKSGHLYTTLKDDVAVLDAVCWKGTYARLGIKPEEGMEVICTGRLTTYPGRSNYQLVIENMELAGVGAILKMIEERRKKLAAEGLFDADRKKKIPFLPGTIGVITSPTGAVIRDILHRLSDRFPVHVLIWPAVVQGASAAAEVVRGIEGFNAMEPRPDLIIVARGGGSIEDLMPFNEESVARAAANSKIPLISAVGHETDVTLIDFAADLRAPTPTGAAEMAVPVREQLVAQILDIQQRLFQTLQGRLENARLRLDRDARLLSHPRRILESPTQRLDLAAARLRTPQDMVDGMALKLKHAGGRLLDMPKRFLESPEKQIAALSRMLESLSFRKVLERGYAVVRDEKGKLVSRAAQLKTENVELVFYDSNVQAKIGK